MISTWSGAARVKAWDQNLNAKPMIGPWVRTSYLKSVVASPVE